MDFQSFYIGAISGATGLLLSHPIDTIKSNIQNKNTIRWIKFGKINQVYKQLYRGVWPPLIGMGFEKAVVFGTYQNIINRIENSIDNPIIARGMAGAGAGAAGSFVVTPVERLKILYQTGQNPLYQTGNSLKFLALRSLYRGFPNTLSREVPGFAIYFNVYYGLKDLSIGKNSDIQALTFFYGALSGMTSWGFIYPQDIIKTRIQASSNQISAINIIKDIYKTDGVKGFYRGFSLALLRAVPLHAGTLSMYEYLSRKD